MFEFGKDLRRLFAQARESDDLGWLELVGADLVEVEARQQSTDAGRISCAQPFSAWARAAALWREHARRTGRGASLDRARAAAADAARAAQGDEQKARAAVETALTRMLAFDLSGDPRRLELALADLDRLKPARRGATAAMIAACHARLKARQARLDGTAGSLLDAAALLDSALHGLGADPAADALRLDRAALTLEAGMTQRDPRLLDQAGRDLRALVESAAPEYRPLGRARALALCGAGLAALAALADDAAAAFQARAMFDAAADQFTPDHSPLDWAAVQIARVGEADPGAPPSVGLLQAEALTADGGLVLGALARERRVMAETRHAEATGDLGALAGIETRLRRGLAARDGDVAPLDWVADQIGLARVALARDALTGTLCDRPVLGLVEAAEVAIETGAPALADVARALTARMSGR